MRSVTWLILGCWATLVVVWTVTAIGAKRPVQRPVGWRVTWLGFPLAFFIVLGLARSGALGPARSWLEAIRASTNPYVAAIGVALCVAGIGLAIWARLHLGANWSPVPAVLERHEL